MPVLSAHWCMAAGHGLHPHMPDRRKDSIPSTKKHPLYPWHIPARQCVQCSGPLPGQPSKHVHPAQTVQTALAGSCLPLWRMVASQKTFSVENWHLEGEPKAGHSCTTRMSARETWKHLISTLSPGRTLQLTAWCGEALWTNTSSQGKRNWWMQKQQKGPAERSTTTLTDQRPHTNATFATEIVSPASVSTQATLQQLNRQDNEDVPPWSNLINGGHYSSSVYSVSLVLHSWMYSIGLHLVPKALPCFKT